MKIIIAKSSGFCVGVRRAVEMALDASTESAKPVYTYGSLIHNSQVLNVLGKKEVHVLEEIPEKGAGTVLIRAHGIPPQAKEKLETAGFSVINATCPRVIKIQTLIKMHTQKGYTSIIIGDKNHPEVVGLFAHAGDSGHVVNTIDELESLPVFDKAVVVAQTTQNTDHFEKIKNWVNNRCPHYIIFDTICDSTEKRQEEVKQLAKTVDAIIVVGGQKSGNTRRLFEIAQQCSKQAFHIETEDDLTALNLDALASAHSLGITAGASTPNWIIKKVCRALEELPYKHKRGWRSKLYSFQRGLLLTNTYLSLGAGGLGYAYAQLQGIAYHMPYVFLSMLYVQSMHTLNHLTGQQSDHYNDPERAGFYKKYRMPLTLIAILSGAAGLWVAYTLGPLPFGILLTMSMLGLSYNLELLPEKTGWPAIRRIRDIPGSKTFLIATAWGVLTVVLPSLASTGTLSWTDLLILIWSTGLVFVRTTFFDILDMQGDRIVGKETIAILIGEKSSLRLLQNILAILICLLPVASAFQLASSMGFALTLCPIFFLTLLYSYKKGILRPGIRLEFLVETQLVVTGIIALSWPLLVGVLF